MVRLSEVYGEAHDIKSENENYFKNGKDKNGNAFIKLAEVKSVQNNNRNTYKQGKETEVEKKSDKRTCYGRGSIVEVIRGSDTCIAGYFSRMHTYYYIASYVEMLCRAYCYVDVINMHVTSEMKLYNGVTVCLAIIYILYSIVYCIYNR